MRTHRDEPVTAPVVLMKWYDWTKWLLDRVDSFPALHDPRAEGARVVAAAPFRDRVVHHAIVRVIEPIFERRFIEDSYACWRGKGEAEGVFLLSVARSGSDGGGNTNTSGGHYRDKADPLKQPKMTQF